MVALKQTVAFLLAFITLLLSGCHAVTDTPPSISLETPSLVTTATSAVSETTTTEPTQETFIPETTATAEIETIPTEVEFDPIAFARQLSTEEKVGQLFLARCPETDAVADIANYHLGGYILFDRDFRDASPDEVRDLIAQFQKQAAIAMLVAVDEEGGTVTRISCYDQYRGNNFPSPRNLYAQGGMALIEETEREKCRLLRDLGVNVNMAPVCDITTDPFSFMYDRSLGQPPHTTAYFTKSVVDIMAEHQIGSVLKHFPGYGNNTDTHTGIATDTRSLNELESADLIPFSIGAKAGCGAILISHTFIEALDSTLPASLSPAVINYLREQMGFNGVAVTDDLAMQAITDLYGAGEAAVLAVLAGNDLLCSSEYQVQYTAVLEAVQSGRITTERLDQAVSRILQWKYRLGLLAE